MTPYFIMTVFLLAGGSNGGGVAIEKVGIYESRSDCMASGTDAGFSHISGFPDGGRFYFACVSAGDPFGAEE